MKTRVCLKYFIHGRSYLAAQYKWARSSEEAKKSKFFGTRLPEKGFSV